jgi:PEGA domain-containing protein
VAVPDPAEAARRWRALRESPEAPVAALTLAASPLEPIDPADEMAAGAQRELVAPPIALPSLEETHVHTRPNGSRNRYLGWALAALALCAILEAAVIARLLMRPASIPPPPAVAQIDLVTNEPGAPVKVDGRLAGVTPLNLSIDSQVRSVSVGSSLALPPKQEMIVGSTGPGTNPRDAGRAAEPRPGTVAPPPQRSGGIRVSSPIELELFAGDRRLGSTATGIVPAPAGRHEIDLVNSVLGFRSRQVVDVVAGQVAAVAVAPPNGRININAVPWAEVLVDGKSVGETPIGNLSLPLGEHEIIFRHPQLGEVRQKTVVRLDAVTRVSANLQR